MQWVGSDCLHPGAKPHWPALVIALHPPKSNFTSHPLWCFPQPGPSAGLWLWNKSPWTQDMYGFQTAPELPLVMFRERISTASFTLFLQPILEPTTKFKDVYESSGHSRQITRKDVKTHLHVQIRDGHKARRSTTSFVVNLWWDTIGAMPNSPPHLPGKPTHCCWCPTGALLCWCHTNLRRGSGCPSLLPVRQLANPTRKLNGGKSRHSWRVASCLGRRGRAAQAPLWNDVLLAKKDPSHGPRTTLCGPAKQGEGWAEAWHLWHHARDSAQSASSCFVPTSSWNVGWRGKYDIVKKISPYLYYGYRNKSQKLVV